MHTLILKDLDLNNKEEVAFLEHLYIESFPLSERRPVDLMFDFYNSNPRFRISVAIRDNKRIGFLTHWDLGDFIFIEHFAISPDFRNGGNGGKVMKSFIAQMTKAIVIEVELPTTILADRRIGFYQRIGFRLWDDILYHQPAYYEETGTIPMKLMTHGDIELKENLTEIRNTIYDEVYGC